MATKAAELIRHPHAHLVIKYENYSDIAGRQIDEPSRANTRQWAIAKCDTPVGNQSIRRRPR